MSDYEKRAKKLKEPEHRSIPTGFQSETRAISSVHGTIIFLGGVA